MDHAFKRLLKGRKGLRVVGDVHGDFEAFALAVDGALSQNLAVLQLGDVINYGPDSLGAMALATALVKEGKGLFLPGNHEAKLLRWYAGHKVPVPAHGLGRTLREVQAHPQGEKILDNFVAVAQKMPIWVTTPTSAFAHAAYCPQMRKRPAPRLVQSVLRNRLARLALNGEVQRSDANGAAHRTYAWADDVPAGQTVYIGHDCVSKERVETRTGVKGGRVMFLDTAAGEGGKLSWVDLPTDGLFHPKRRV